MSTTLALALLETLIVHVPPLAAWIAKGLVGDDSPLADQVRAILPLESASGAARVELERDLEGVALERDRGDD